MINKIKKPFKIGDVKVRAVDKSVYRMRSIQLRYTTELNKAQKELLHYLKSLANDSYMRELSQAEMTAIFIAVNQVLIAHDNLRSFLSGGILCD